MIKIRKWFPLGTRKLTLKGYKSNFWDVLYLFWLHRHTQLSIIIEQNTKDLCTLLSINYTQSKIRKKCFPKLCDTLMLKQPSVRPPLTNASYKEEEHSPVQLPPPTLPQTNNLQYSSILEHRGTEQDMGRAERHNKYLGSISSYKLFYTQYLLECPRSTSVK